ncbi:MAG: alpha/beta hydrolase, partial [Alphaproteobacteria bacterium]|nr:alpha/beta hydrolase [Alphaproteobacteria bacterium]
MPMTFRRLWMFLATAIALPACSTFTLLNATISEDGFTVKPGIRYGPDVRHGLDIYVPKQRKGPLPVIV